MSRSSDRVAPPRWARAVLWIMILAFAAYFSVVSVRLHLAQDTYKSDLGQMDQAIWNTSQGRFVQETRGDHLTTRMTDHVEPIYAPISLVFWLWDDVAALLVLQAVALAVGAWPVFHIAYGRLVHRKTKPSHPGGLAALAFALAYLLYPPLQAGAVAEFHALPLATPLILIAFLCADRRRWLVFAISALLVAMVQEGMALVTAALGVYAIGYGLWLRRKARRSRTDGAPGAVSSRRDSARPALLLGLLVLAGGLAWFYAATFVIIPAYASAAYGLGETPYAARFGALGNSFGDVIRTMVLRPGQVLKVAAEPLRIQYVVRLLAPVGFLALAGPEILLLGLPLFLANLLSAYAFQYSGQLHYSTPLAAFVLMAAIVGTARLRHLSRRISVSLRLHRLWKAYRAYLPLLIWLLVWSIGCQIAFGYSPVGRQFRYTWPEITQHDRLLERFVDQIPPDARLATMAHLYPHVTHRQFLYQFPALADAEYVLLDVSARSGWITHPADVRNQVAKMLQSGQWAVRDAADGYLLLQRTTEAKPTTLQELPAEFYTFAEPAADPQIPLDLTFTQPGAGPDGPKLKLLGYDVVPDERWRGVGFRFYWQALTPLPEDVKLRTFVVAPNGDEVDNDQARPLLQTLWPGAQPAAWPVGQTMVTDKLPWYLPKQWAPAVGVYQGESWDSEDARWQVSDASGTTPLYDSATWAMLRPEAWQESRLAPMATQTGATLNEVFAGDGWKVTLTGMADEQERVAPGQRVPIALQWLSDGPAPRDYTIFVHLRDSQGNTVAQADSTPTWFGRQPTTHWRSGQTVLSGHTLQLPADLKPGVYDLVVGWYYWDTMERLAHLTADGQPSGDDAVVGQLRVDSTAAPDPDLACALVPESCASQ